MINLVSGLLNLKTMASGGRRCDWVVVSAFNHPRINQIILNKLLLSAEFYFISIKRVNRTAHAHTPTRAEK